MKTSLQGKTIVLFILIAVVIGASGLIVSSRFINDIIDDTYKNKANDIAHTMAVVIDVDDAAQLQKEVRSIFDNTEEKVGSEEWGSEAFNAYIGRFAHLEETKEFQNLQNQLRLIQDENDVDCLYLSIVDAPTLSMIYLVDGAYEEACLTASFSTQIATTSSPPVNAWRDQTFVLSPWPSPGIRRAVKALLSPRMSWRRRRA